MEGTLALQMWDCVCVCVGHIFVLLRETFSAQMTSVILLLTLLIL